MKVEKANTIKYIIIPEYIYYVMSISGADPTVGFTNNGCSIELYMYLIMDEELSIVKAYVPFLFSKF